MHPADDQPSPPPPPPRRRRWLAVVLSTLLLLGLPHLVVNAALNLLVPALLNERPDKLHVRFERAWMLVPWELNVRQLEIRGQGERVQWWLTLPEARGQVRPFALLDRSFQVDELRAEAATFHYRAIREAPLPDGADDPTAPIPGLSNPPDPPPSPHRSPKPWSIQLTDVDVSRVDELWFEGWRLSPGGGLSGSLTLLEEASGQISLRLAGGELLYQGDRWFHDVHGDFDVTLDALPRFEPMDRHTLERVVATTQVTASVTDLEILSYYLQDTPWLDIAGAASVEAVGSIDHGVLGAGTQVYANAEALDVDFRAYRIHGPAEVKVQVQGEPDKLQTQLSLDLGRFTIAERGRPVIVRGEGLQVMAGSGAATLLQPLRELEVTMTLPRSEVVSLDEFTRLLPSGFGLSVTGGSGWIEGELSALDAGARSSGALRAYVRHLRGTLDGMDVVTDVAANAVLDSGDLQRGVYDFSGTQIRLDRLSLAEAGAPPDRRWWAVADAPSGVARVGAQTYLETTLRLTCADSRPFVQLAARQKKLPGWVQNLLDVEDVRGRAKLRLQRDAVAVDQLAVTGGPAEVQLKLFRRGRSRGALFAKYGVLSLGIGFDGPQRSFHPFGARRWFDKQPLPE